MSSINNTWPSSRSVSDTLEMVTHRFVNQLPLVFTVMGLVGFIGNAFTFLQPSLRWNTFCIYSLVGSFVDLINLFIDLFPNYINIINGNLITPISSGILCKLKVFALVFVPQLSLNLLILSMIDRYISTCSLTSSLRRLHQLKLVPWLIGITVIFTCLISLYSPILNDFVVGIGCTSLNAILNTGLYIGIQGVLTPAVMIALILYTYRNIVQSRRRVATVATVSKNHPRAQFIGMIFVQIIITNFFVLQWMAVCLYFWITLDSGKSAEEWAITYFILALSNNLYYIINVKSFYTSTLVSRVFRDALKTGVLKFICRRPHLG